MSPVKRYTRKRAKAKQRQRLNAQKRHQCQQRQAQRDIDALRQALDDLGLPDMRIGNSKSHFSGAPPPLGPSATRWRPPLTHGESSVPSTQRLLAVAACSKAERGKARSGQAEQDG